MMNEVLDKLTVQELGRRLKAVRARLSMTQGEVASEIGTSQFVMSRIESGKNVTSPVLIRLLAFYSLSTDISKVFAPNFDALHTELHSEEFIMRDNIKARLQNLKEKIRHSHSEIEKFIDTTLDAW